MMQGSANNRSVYPTV